MDKIVYAKFSALICTGVGEQKMWNGNYVIYPVIKGKVFKLGNISKCISVYKVVF